MMLPFLNDSFGLIPDLLRGKDPKKALTDNVKQGLMVGGAALAAPALGGGAAAGGASAAAPMPVFDPTAGQWLQSSTAAVQGTSGSGLLSGFGQYIDPAAKSINAASQAQGLLNPPEQPIQAQPLQSRPVDFGGLLSQRPQAMSDQDRYMQRIQAMMQGGYRG